MPNYTAVKRSAFAQFLNVGDPDTPVWARMGQGIVDNTINYNGSVTSETYIHEDSASNNVDSVAPSIPVTQWAYKGDPVFEFVDNLRRNRAIGSDCETEILLVYVYESEETTSGSSTVVTYAAEKNKCAIQYDSFGGAGGQRNQIGYNVLFNGDPVIGTATITDGTPNFTAA